MITKKTKMRKLKKLAAVLLSAAMAVSLTGCGTSDEAESGSEAVTTAEVTESVTLNVGVMSGGTEHCIAVIGIETGVYEKYGLDVVITEFGSGVEAVTAVTLEQVDVAESFDYGAINLIGQTSDSTNLTIIAQNYETSEDSDTGSSQLYVNPEVVTSLDDLEGKNVSVQVGTANEYLVAKTCEYLGMTTDDINLVAVDGPTTSVTAAENGEIDAVWSTGTYADKFVDMGWEVLLVDTEIGYMNRDVSVSSVEYIEENSDVLVSYMQARAEIVAYIEENQDDAAAIAAAQLTLSEDDFIGQIEGYTIGSKLTEEVIEGLQDVADWAYGNGNFETEVDITEFIDSSVISEALPDNV